MVERPGKARQQECASVERRFAHHLQRNLKLNATYLGAALYPALLQQREALAIVKNADEC